jgi:hypothetical protein
VKTISLKRVKYLPRELAPGILYVSEEYAVAGHLCACGCGSKVITPLGPAEWSFMDRGGLPTLSPSVGNWQLPCRSHYVITAGRIRWAGQWSDAAILAGRQAEEQRRRTHYESLPVKRGLWATVWSSIRRLFGR